MLFELLFSARSFFSQNIYGDNNCLLQCTIKKVKLVPLNYRLMSPKQCNYGTTVIQWGSAYGSLLTSAFVW